MQQTCIRIMVGVLAFTLGVFIYAIWSRLERHDTRSAVAPTLSIDEKWHRLYEAAGMSGDAELMDEVSDRLLCTNRAGVPEAWPVDIEETVRCQKADKSIHELRLNELSEYGSFSWRITTSHRSWTLHNFDFARSVITAKNAKEYVLSHEWPPDR